MMGLFGMPMMPQDPRGMGGQQAPWAQQGSPQGSPQVDLSKLFSPSSPEMGQLAMNLGQQLNPMMGMGLGQTPLMEQMYGQRPYQSFLQNQLPGVPQGATLPEGFRNTFTPPSWNFLEDMKKKAGAELKKKRRNAQASRRRNPKIAGEGTLSGPGSGGR